jgi:hypothetical protein
LRPVPNIYRHKYNFIGYESNKHKSAVGAHFRDKCCEYTITSNQNPPFLYEEIHDNLKSKPALPTRGDTR